MKFYRGNAAAARNYVEADRSRADDYYLAEGAGVAERYVADAHPEGSARSSSVVSAGGMDGDTYERWVAGHEVETGAPKGRLRKDEHALRFVEVIVNGPKTWSLAAALHPEISEAYDAAQERAATEIIGWVAEHATARVGPHGRQVQVPVEQIEAAVVRHYTSRAGDPHRHLHLQINARVSTGSTNGLRTWRGLHSVGVVDSINAINGIGHAAVMCDPGFRQALADHGYTLDPDSGEVVQLAPYTGAFSARAAQINRNTDRYEAQWRAENPGQEPGPALHRIWDRRAWSDARPDKVVPHDGRDFVDGWTDELHDLGFVEPEVARDLASTPIGRLNRDAVAEIALSRLGARRSGWNAADIRGEIETLISGLDIVAAPAVRRELTEDLTARAVDRCLSLLDRDDVPEHVRALTSNHVLDVEADLELRLVTRADTGADTRAEPPVARGSMSGNVDSAQRQAATALAGTAGLVVVEGAAGAGKTATLAAVRDLLEANRHRLLIVTPTLKAAHAAEREVGTGAHSAGWLVHQYGFRWDEHGRWSREDARPPVGRGLGKGDLLVVDEAGMLDQDTARALLAIADETGARVALVGDRHQLPAVGRGGVLDLAARWAPPGAHLTLDTVHRFVDKEYADLTLLMRTGDQASDVFDALLQRGEIVLHPSEVERIEAFAELDGLVMADTRDQVRDLNAVIRDHRTEPAFGPAAITTSRGEQVGLGDPITTRRNDRDLDVANRDTWTVTGVAAEGRLRVSGERGERILPATYVRANVELAYATTVYGAQGQTVDTAHLLVGEGTGAAAAYVGMTRGRQRNIAHLVADSVEDARLQWVRTFSRDRADLGPAHAAEVAGQDIERYGPAARPSVPRRRPAEPLPPPNRPEPTQGVGI